jgi:hypothetical protein
MNSSSLVCLDVGSLLTLLPVHWVSFACALGLFWHFCTPLCTPLCTHQLRAGGGTLPFYQIPGPERTMSQVSGMSGFKISGTSGFDMDYASHIRAAGREQVDLMIQSSWTWGAFGARHAAGDAMRAVENGFTLLRCSSDGVTAVYSPQGETIAQTYSGVCMHMLYVYILISSRDSRYSFTST